MQISLALGGDDNLNGGRGFLDRLFGDDGNDILTDPDGVNGAHGGSGDDRLRITFVPEWDNNTNPSDEPRSDGKITGGFGNDVITLTMNHDGFFINLKGDLPSPINDPQDGNDRITLQGLYATSLVDLGGGNDRFIGGIGRDNVSGRDGRDRIFGNEGNDALFGEGGNDTLVGGEGNDLLEGGNGRDIFVLNEGDGTDRITDFSIDLDRIGLSGGLMPDGVMVSGMNGGADALLEVTATGEDLAILSGVDFNLISPSNFVLA